MKAKSLKDLQAIGRTLAEQHAVQAEQLARRQLAAQRAKAEQELFALAVGTIRPLRHKPPADLGRPRAQPVAHMHQRDEQAVLRESLSDGFDSGRLLETDDQLSYRRAGIGPDVLRKLRNGHWSIQRQIDLHGLRTDEAREALGQFLREARRDALRCLRVVHGKGLGSPGKTPVLKSRVLGWLMQKKEVMAFVQARPVDGGAGAVLVLLQPGAHSAA
jgi:DNA-nicking Smr family endonuclease